MNLLLQTRFHPNVGGVETIADILAREWMRAGVQVAVSTDVPCVAGQQKPFPFPVHYTPSGFTLLRLARWADIIVQMNVSLKAIWPLVLLRRPFVAVHHGFYICDRSGRRDWRERLKLRIAHNASANIAVSRAVARVMGVDCDIIPNAYDDSVFNTLDATRKPGSLIFVGRLVSDKGADLLLAALERLRKQKIKPALTIVGDGPERTALEKTLMEMALADQVRFTGQLGQSQVAAELREHEIIVVPSLVEESFGIVALEGAACGCVVVGADAGGLPEAIGPTGLTFRRGNVADLAEKLAFLLTHPEKRERFRAAAPVYLEKHRPAYVTDQYLQVFRRVLSQ